MPFTIEDLNYEKDSKERMPWEHYLEQYGQADPQVLGENLGILYDQENRCFTLTFLGTVYHITYHFKMKCLLKAPASFLTDVIFCFRPPYGRHKRR